VAVLLALASSVLWGSADFLGGLLSRRLPALAVVAWSQSAGLVTVLAVALATGAFADPTGWVGWGVAAGIAGPVGLVAFYTALSVGTMGVVSPIAALGAVVPVLAGLLSGEQPTAVQNAGIVLGLVGAVAAGGPELSPLRRGPAGAGARSVALAAIAGGAFGVALVAIARGAASSPVMTLVGMRATSVLAFLLVGVLLRSAGGVRPRDLASLAIVGVGDVLANLAFALASTRGMVSVVAVLAALYPVATVVLGRVLLHERLAGVQQAGVSVALVGVVLLAVG
jgi:drug/metabolite transporter (DMT)-like permease